MSPDEFINLLITIFIICIFIYISLNIYYLAVFIANSMGFYGMFLDYEFFLSDLSSAFIRGFIMPLQAYYLLINIWALFWIFVFWLLIIIFVPFLILVPIPLIPFILPIPLKIPMLLIIPPFKILTDRGILPLFRDIVFNFIFSEDDIKKRLQRPFIQTYGYLFDEIKKIFGDLGILYSNKPEKQNISKGLQDDNHKFDIGNEKEAKSKEKRLNKNELKRQKNINLEETNCRNNNKKFATIDMSKSEIMSNSVMDQKDGTRCQIKATRAYIDNLS